MSNIDKAFPTRVRKTTVKPAMKEPRQLTRFELWAWSPITAFRLGLTATYLATIYFGISALIAGIPAFNLTAPNGWTPIWASLVTLGAMVGAIGSISDRHLFRRLELGGAWTLFVTIGIYAVVLLLLAYGAGDPNRAAVGAVLVVCGVTPAVRMVWLMSQLGRK